jgi:hypothetical protein
MTQAQPPRRTGSATDDDHVDLRVTRVQPAHAAPRISAAMWVVAAFVVIAVVKPWGGGGRSAATLAPQLGAPLEVASAPTEDRSAIGLAMPVCLGTGAWRVATLETWRERDVRVWRAIEPVTEATGPLDVAIPAVPVVADLLSGLGWCAPAFGDDEPVGPATVRAWLVVGGVARVVALRQVQPADGVTPIAALYVPQGGAWTTGRVVFQYRDDGTGTVRWFAADLQVLATLPGGSNAPSAAASGAGAAAASPAR